MVRDNSNDYYSNALSWPESFTQHNDFKEIYFNGSAAIHHGRHEIKAGIESDNLFCTKTSATPFPTASARRTSRAPIAHCPGALRSRHAVDFCLHRQAGSRAVGLCAGCHPVGQLDGERGAALGHYQLLVNQNAVSRGFRLRTISARPVCWFISPTTASSRRRHLRTYCYPAHRRCCRWTRDR